MPEQALNRHGRQVLEWITDGFYALDRDFRFIYINAAAERILGQPRDELLGANLWEAFPPAIDTPIFAAYHEALATGQTITIEFYYPPFESWFEVRVFPAPEGLSVFFRDVSRSRQLTEALRESESKYRSLIDHLPAAVYMVANDEWQTPLYLSPRHEALTGYTDEEVLGRTRHWLDLVHPDDRDRVTAENQRAETYREAFRAEYRLRCKDGSYIWVLDECVPVRDASGKIAAWHGVLLDISERVAAEERLRASEARFRAVWETTADAIALSAPDGTVLAANPAYGELYGSPPEVVVGQNSAIMFPEAERDAAIARYREVFADPHVPLPLSYLGTVQRADGTRRDVEARAAFLEIDGQRLAMVSSIRDVTDHARLERELRASEEKFRSLVVQLPAVVYILGTDDLQTPLYFSPYIQTLLGYTPEEAMAPDHNWLERVHPEDRGQFAGEGLQAEATGTGRRIEYRYRHKDGHYVWVLDDSVAIRDESGALVAWQGVILDISERVQAEEERARLAAIVESAEDGILSCTLDGIITSWNFGAEKLFGYRIDEAIGRDVTMLRPPDLHDDIAVLMARVRQGKSIEGHETERVTKDGRRIAVSLSISPIRDIHGRIVGIASISRDITALRQAEAALRLRDQALAAMTSGILIIDATAPDGAIVDVNPAFEILTGYTRDEAIGNSAGILFGPDTDLTAAQRIRNAVRSGNDITETLLTARRDGTSFWGHHNVTAVRDHAGNLTHFVGVLTDVSERVQAEAALAQERDLLQTLLEHLPDAVYIKDTASRFLRLNQATARELGVSMVEEAIGKSDHDFFPEALAEEYISDERRLLTAGEALVNKPERQTESGDGRWVLATKVPFRDANGDIVGLVGINRDITELQRLQEERDRLYAELEAEFRRAAEVQALMVPHEAPEIAGYEFAGTCLPARQVGGDFFDWTVDDDLVRLSLGDVMGKGMAAALQTATVRAALRTVTSRSVSDAVENVNRALSPDLIQSDSFITLFHANLDTATGVLTYIDAGHGMAFVQRRSGAVEPLRQHALPLGVLVEAEYPCGTTTLEPGDTLVIHSDGLPDARPDLRLDAVGVARQIDGLLDAQSKLEQLVQLVAEIPSRPDDLTLVVLRREDVDPGGTSAGQGLSLWA